MANLTTDKNLDKHIRPVKSGGEDTSLELATKGNLTRVTGDLEVLGNINDLKILNNLIESSSSIRLLASNGISLAAGGGDVDISGQGDINITTTGGQVNITDNGLTDPDLVLTSTSTAGIGPNIYFQHLSSDPDDGDTPGSIYFVGYNDNGQGISYGSILNEAVDVSDSSELGMLTLKVAAVSDCAGLVLRGISSARVDATIGNGAASLTTIAGDLDIDGDTITSAGALEIDAGGSVSITGQNLEIDATRKLRLDGGTGTYIWESSDDVMELVVGGDKMLTLDEANDKITMGATNWVAGTVSGGTVTEFSAANSAYAGMMLGCTHVYGSGTNGQFMTVGTSFVSLVWDTDKYALVTFVVPPSNKVKISVFLPFVQLSGNILQLGLGTDSSATSLGNKYKNNSWDVDETDTVGINYSWVVEGSDHSWSAGETKTIYIIGYADSNIRLYTGGTAADKYGGVIVEATALPATIGDGSEP